MDASAGHPAQQRARRALTAVLLTGQQRGPCWDRGLHASAAAPVELAAGQPSAAAAAAGDCCSGCPWVPLNAANPLMQVFLATSYPHAQCWWLTSLGLRELRPLRIAMLPERLLFIIWPAKLGRRCQWLVRVHRWHMCVTWGCCRPRNCGMHSRRLLAGSMLLSCHPPGTVSAEQALHGLGPLCVAVGVVATMRVIAGGPSGHPNRRSGACRLHRGE